MEALVEITVSDRCNKNCSYCFEKHVDCHVDRFDEWKSLILNACEDIQANKLSDIDRLQLTFWGGEPFIRYDRMLDLIGATSKYGFVSYHVYTNGTLEDEIRNFANDDLFKNIADRFSVQVSYDGAPCNEKRRGYGFDSIRQQALMLAQAGAHVSFKATVCYDDIELLPQLWDSYEKLIGEWPGVKYCPTFDSIGQYKGDIETWREIVENLCKREYRFFKKYGRFLMSWFDDEQPRRCRLDNRVFLHTDGIQYVCHGCPYVSDLRFKIGSIADKRLVFIKDLKNNRRENASCASCDATYCVYCNIAGMPPGELRDVWNTGCCCKNSVCQLYRTFGRYRRILLYALMKGK